MFIRNKGFEGDYFTATEGRISKIRNTQCNSDEILERLFGITDINKFISTLEDELFFEIISNSASQKLFNAIKKGKISQNDFKDEYIYSGEDGFIGFCTMLRVL